MSIEVRNLVKTYGEQKAVNQLSFSVNKGEIVGFLGPNGAGKSTTMKMITGYLTPDSGEIFVCGIPVLSRPLEAKSKTGYLPEANPLYYDMYVGEYLNFIAGIHRIPNKKKSIKNVIDMTGLGPESIKRIGQLSKGYKQRVGLAAALIHEPEVLILDEPTSGLDPNQIIEIREVIRQLGKQKTVLFSTHILQEVEALCERVIIINKGEMVANDRLAALQQTEMVSSIRIGFQEILAPDWAEGLPGVQNLKKLDDQSWRLETGDPDTLRKKLMAMAVERNLTILSLQTESRNLEDIFRSLTNP